MNLNRYQYKRKESGTDYIFYSEGEKGRILKVVYFTRFNHEPPFYDLSFGDWDKEAHCLDVVAVTNNRDTEKVLATLAAIIKDFTDNFRDAVVNLEGLGDARKRLYRISVNNLFHETNKIFNIYGAIGDQYEPFRKDVAYQRFLITRKDSVTLEEQVEIYITSSPKKMEEIQEIFDYLDANGLTLADVSDPVIRKKTEDARKRFERIGFPSREDLLKLPDTPLIKRP